MKKIDTLVKDIYDRISSKEPFPEEAVSQFSTNLSRKLVSRLSEEKSAPTLRLSNLGTPDRKLWYTINRPELAEPLSASAKLKFLLGDILEEVLLFLARASGHSVSSEQRKVDLHGVSGSIDSVIDGRLVDVKSASPASFNKFANGLTKQTDGFGYLSQLGGYLHSDLNADLTDKDKASFLVGHKVTGKITLDTHTFPDVDYKELVEQKKQMLAWPVPPDRCYPDVKEGESGNRKLGFQCSYCPFKASCWPGLRVFAYKDKDSIKPVFLTKVVKEPRVPEMKLHEAAED